MWSRPTPRSSTPRTESSQRKRSRPSRSPRTSSKALEAALKGAFTSVELRTSVEPALVGGLVVRAFGRTYDGSVREHLAALRRRLAATS